MTWETRHRRNWRGKLVLQVKPLSIMAWRDATQRDLEQLEVQKQIEREREARQRKDCLAYFYPKGLRVVVNQQSGFHKGARGVVEFQEPASGRVWVTRDGADSACFFWANELGPEPGMFTAPQRARVEMFDKQLDYWWVAIGDGMMPERSTMRWCEENGIPGPAYRSYGGYLSLVGFAAEGDATLFYLRFKR